MNTPALLEAISLKKEFQQGTSRIEVLKGVNFRVEAGETVAIVGRSGSGKSTLLSILAGLDRPTSGSLHLSGTDFNSLDEDRLAAFRGKNLGIVFQQFHLMSTLTALENVSLPLEIARDPDATAKARVALESVGLGHRGHHLPSQMSGGECQRVAIARAFVGEPRLLLADEPSGNLDTRTGDDVLRLLFDLVDKRAMTLILVTHNEALAQSCNRQLRLDDGAFVEANL